MKLRSLGIGWLASVAVAPLCWSQSSMPADPPSCNVHAPEPSPVAMGLNDRVGEAATNFGTACPVAVGNAALRTSTAAIAADLPNGKAPSAPKPSASIVLGSLTWRGNHGTALDTQGQRHALTLNRALQEAATQALRQARPSRGAVVMLSVSDGRILALSELPAAVPPSQSLVWSAQTPSASLFKLVTTAVLLERAHLQPDHRVCSEGGEHRLEVRHLEAPKQGRVVCSEFAEILAASRNAAYARLVHAHLAPEDLSNYADRFGFNVPLPADVPAEMGRFHPASEPLALARTATGFVGSWLSALGAAHLAFVLARGGVSHPIKVLEPNSANSSSGQADARDAHTSPDEITSLRVIAPHTASRLRDMMERVVSHGTAAEAFRDALGEATTARLKVAGKTGTLGIDEHTASWFIGFAPSRAPKLVVAVLLENGTVWHTTAKVIAGNLMREYFETAR